MSPSIKTTGYRTYCIMTDGIYANNNAGNPGICQIMNNQD